jgi:hypothetical protein
MVSSRLRLYVCYIESCCVRAQTIGSIGVHVAMTVSTPLQTHATVMLTCCDPLQCYFYCYNTIIRGADGCTESAMDLAASNGHLQVVKYLHSIGKPCTTSAADGACAGGHLQVLEFLHRC